MEILGILLILISVIIISGIFIIFMFDLGILWGFIAIALVTGWLGMSLLDGTDD